MHWVCSIQLWWMMMDSLNINDTSPFWMNTTLFTASKMFFNSCHIMYRHYNKHSVLTHDFQLITKNCHTQSSLRSVENQMEKHKNYCVANITISQLLKHISQAMKVMLLTLEMESDKTCNFKYWAIGNANINFRLHPTCCFNRANHCCPTARWFWLCEGVILAFAREQSW